MPDETDAAFERLDVLIGRWKTSQSDRFTGTFNDERTLITGHWDARDDDSDWRPWMDITLTKQAT
jgi:hypothetical protein